VAGRGVLLWLLLVVIMRRRLVRLDDAAPVMMGGVSMVRGILFCGGVVGRDGHRRLLPMEILR
jgi:hypothetical protein